jgi:hypothetical protein
MVKYGVGLVLELNGNSTNSDRARRLDSSFLYAVATNATSRLSALTDFLSAISLCLGSLFLGTTHKEEKLAVSMVMKSLNCPTDGSRGILRLIGSFVFTSSPRRTPSAKSPPLWSIPHRLFL